MAHDIGKATVRFNGKLREAVSNKPGTSSQADRIRHEWVSVKMLETWRTMMTDWEAARAGGLSIPQPTLVDALANIEKKGQMMDAPEFMVRRKQGLLRSIDPISTVHKVMDAAILTHHGILGPARKDSSVPSGSLPDDSRHIRGSDQDLELFTKTFAGTGFSPETEQELWALIQQARNREQDDSEDLDYWRGILLTSRAALIAADHYVSAMRPAGSTPKKGAKMLYANTARDEGRRSLNQLLDWHLEHVSEYAGIFARHLGEPRDLPGLSPDGREKVDIRSGPGLFEWQDKAVDHLQSLRSTSTGPRLILNMASTGSGKTRANLRIASAMRSDEEPLRVSLALNLRSLTLQTNDALRDQMEIPDTDIACVIGDTFTKRAHDSAKTNENEDNDETDDGDIEVAWSGHPLTPRWLDEWLTHPETGEMDRKTRAMIAAPILISTIDYIIRAGEPGRQGHHAKALARVGSSDLILDEIDSYSPSSMVAVLRVVMTAAALGRNVIASSATLSRPVANALARAFTAGARIHASLTNVPTEDRYTQITLIDNELSPESRDLTDITDFDTWYSQHISLLMACVANKPTYRLAYLQEIAGDKDWGPIDRFTASIHVAAKSLHRNHRWRHPSGKWVSFGVVRVANIVPCVKVAHYLQSQPGIQAITYHAKELRIKRFLKERRLDRLFSRKDPASCPLSLDPEIEEIVRKTDSDEVIFVIVATPVEEVGRDHDFDWAVIEPSSTASIIQMSGRVNRHRLVDVSVPNIAILDFNLKAIKGEDSVCFTRPGNENGASHRGEHSAATLLSNAQGWQAGTIKITAQLHFGNGIHQCYFAEYDDASVEEQIKEGIKSIEAHHYPGNKNPLSWLTQSHYDAYTLRERAPKTRLRLVRNQGRPGWHFEQLQVTPRGEGWNPISVEIREPCPGGKPLWMRCELDDALRAAQDISGDAGGSQGMELETELTPFESKPFFYDAEMGGIHALKQSEA
jgi:CRISPR-associated endonuclease/helicase Cas3